jgi:dipeptidyl aminopeptidase/acylaminoacyl peptidase
MGPVRHPGSYRCAASFAGVTDLTKMYSGFWTDIAEHYRRYNLAQLLGDERADAEMLRRFSPINRVAEIKVPLFLAHGRDDRRVDIAHTERFATAAREAGLPVEVLAFSNEGHGFSSQRNHARYLEALAVFLQRHLGGGAVR